MHKINNFELIINSNRMKYIVIGLGNFGGLLSTRLTEMGHEVIGVDSDSERVDALKDTISGTVRIDAASADGMSVLPLGEVNVVIVAIGKNFASSVQAVAQLRRLGVRHIIARGINPLHIGVLQTLGVERVVFPEKDGAELLSQSLAYGDFLSSYRIDNEHYVMQFVAPSQFVGRTISGCGLEGDYDLKIITIKHTTVARNMLGLQHSQRTVAGTISPDTVISQGDILVVYGTLKSYDSFSRSIA